MSRNLVDYQRFMKIYPDGFLALYQHILWSTRLAASPRLQGIVLAVPLTRPRLHWLKS